MNKEWRKEEGAVLIVAIFVVMALVVVGSLATMLTTVEMDISRNDKIAKEAFFVADAGCPISTEVLKDMILDEGITYSDPKYMTSGVFFDSYIFMNEVRNYYDPVTEPDLNDKNVDTPDNMPDITAQVAGRNIAIDVDWRHIKSGAGGSLLFAMGYEGIGADRSHVGVKIYYDIYSKGRTTGKNAAEIKTVYLSQ
jgi:hypothetical protein